MLNDTVQSRMLGAGDHAGEIDSPDPPGAGGQVVRNAERGCFVLQALQNPVPVTGRTLLNGSLTGIRNRGRLPRALSGSAGRGRGLGASRRGPE